MCLPDEHQERAVISAVLADPVCAIVLERMPQLALDEWWLTGGAVFQNVWNAVEGRPPGYGIKDYDMFYFDDGDLSWEAEDLVIRRAAAVFEDVPATVEVKNQARVHLWYEDAFGAPMRPCTNATDAIDSFASTTCCVGVTRDHDGPRLYAPFGLDDVLAMHMRPHRRLAPQHVYEAKVAAYRSRWPALTSDAW